MQVHDHKRYPWLPALEGDEENSEKEERGPSVATDEDSNISLSVKVLISLFLGEIVNMPLDTVCRGTQEEGGREVPAGFWGGRATGQPLDAQNSPAKGPWLRGSKLLMFA